MDVSQQVNFRRLPLGGPCCSYYNIARYSLSARPACEANCSAQRSCHFFSFLEGPTKRGVAFNCILCSNCHLRVGGDGGEFSSWGRYADHQMPLQPVSVSRVVSDLLTPMLQDEYSERLLGARGLVDIPSLRVIWLRLLSASALARLAAVGVCSINSRPPFQPLYYGHDMVATPVDTLWIHPTSMPAPAANYSWVEVTHCPRRNHVSAMWLYAAAGSGVSINVGRTLVISRVKQAKQLLGALFLERSFSDVHPSCSNTSAAEIEAGGLEADPYVTSALGEFGDEHSGTWLDNKARAFLVADAITRGFDSLQILSNVEFYSNEPRHEIIMLKFSECQSIDALGLPGVMQCGKFPHLRACGSGSDALARLAECNGGLTPSKLFSPAIRGVSGLLGRKCTVHHGCIHLRRNRTMEFLCPRGADRYGHIAAHERSQTANG